MGRWLRVVLPGGEFVGPFVGTYACIESMHWLPVLAAGVRGPDEFTVARDLWVFAAAVVYGLSRIIRFHPLYDGAYRNWLVTTPWTAARPLPVGPLHLVTQDAAIVLVLMLLALPRLVSDPLRVPLGFLFGYLAALAVSLWPTGARGYAYALAFGLGLVVRLWAHSLAALAVAAALSPLAYFGLRHSLRCFPWEVPRFFRLSWWKAQAASEHDPDLPRQRVLGWPFDRLPPRPDPPSISAVDGTLVSLLAGWWTYAIAGLSVDVAGGPPARGDLVFWLVPLSLVPLGIGASLRSMLYFWAHKPPISFWGRIRTFRWIIPGYDRATLAPGASIALSLAALLVAGLALPPGLVSPAVLCALPITVGLLILLGGQPSLRRWHLTGKHRIVPGYTKNKTFPALTGDYFDEVIEI